jgi:hypothetical protein
MLKQLKRVSLQTLTASQSLYKSKKNVLRIFGYAARFRLINFRKFLTSRKFQQPYTQNEK